MLTMTANMDESTAFPAPFCDTNVQRVARRRVKTKGAVKRKPIRVGRRKVGIAENKRDRDWAMPCAVARRGAVRRAVRRTDGAARERMGRTAFAWEKGWVEWEFERARDLTYVFSGEDGGHVTVVTVVAANVVATFWVELAEGEVERANVVSGVAKMMRRMEADWTKLMIIT